jgi:WD40 repeat protein
MRRIMWLPSLLLPRAMTLTCLVVQSNVKAYHWPLLRDKERIAQWASIASCGRTRLIALHSAIIALYERHLETVERDSVDPSHDDDSTETKRGHARQLHPSMASRLFYNHKYARAVMDFMGFEPPEIPSFPGLCLIGHVTAVTTVIQLSDGRVCSACAAGTIRIWNCVTGFCEMELLGHRNHQAVRCLIQVLNGRLWSGADDTTIRVWDVETGSCEKIITGHDHYVSSLI